ncbi:hypothetical protein LCGC14_3012840 [marine sediment metagenome]|uniref:Uncharacterized protein n=1 Tax=marine sediment metagenome TaxID=412755 RepID=A0A0F8WY51_9ZZZZ
MSDKSLEEQIRVASRIELSSYRNRRIDALAEQVGAREAALREIDRLTEDYPDHYLGQIARAALTPEDTDAQA